MNTLTSVSGSVPSFLFSPAGYCTVHCITVIIQLKWERAVMCARRAVTFGLRAQKLDIRSSYNSQDGRRWVRRGSAWKSGRFWQRSSAQGRQTWFFAVPEQGSGWKSQYAVREYASTREKFVDPIWLTPRLGIVGKVDSVLVAMHEKTEYTG